MISSNRNQSPPQSSKARTGSPPGRPGDGRLGSPGKLGIGTIGAAVKASKKMKKPGSPSRMLAERQNSFNRLQISDDERDAKYKELEAKLEREVKQLKDQLEKKICFQCKKNEHKHRNPFRKIQSKIDKRANELLKSIDFTQLVKEGFPEVNLNNINSFLLNYRAEPVSSEESAHHMSNHVNASATELVSNDDNSNNNCEAKAEAKPRSSEGRPRVKTLKNTTMQEIQVFSAKNLPNADGIFGSADPYVVLKWTTDRENWVEIGKTPTLKKNLNPVWENQCFDVLSDATTKLTLASALVIEVWDWDLIGNHNFLGGYEASYEELKVWFKESEVTLEKSIRRELKLGRLSTLDNSINQSLADKGDSLVEIGIMAVPYSELRSKPVTGESAAEISLTSSFLGSLSQKLIGKRSSSPSGIEGKATRSMSPALGESMNNQSNAVSLNKKERKERNRIKDLDPKSENFELQVYCASGLAKADLLFGKSDPYIVVKWNDVEIGRTPHITKTLNPVWTDQIFDLSLPYFEDQGHSSLLFEVWDYDVVGSHDFLGGFDVTGEELRSWLEEARVGKGDFHDSISIKRTLSLATVDYLNADDQKLAQGNIEIGIKRLGAYRDPFYEINEETDTANYDEGLVLTRHIIDCIFTLKHVLALKNGRDVGDLKENEVKSVPEIFCRGVIAELVKVVINTITNPFDEVSSASNENATKKQLEDYFNTSGYILELFPEKFNKATRPLELNLLHLAVKYTPVGNSNRVIKMILKFDPKMACYIDENYQTPLHLALRNKKSTLENIKLLVEANKSALEMLDINGFAPLHIAAMSEEEELLDFEIFKYILEEYPRAVLMSCKKGRLPLHFAANNLTVDARFIRLLVSKHPTSLAIACKKSWLPLHRLVSRENVSLEALKLLLNSPQIQVSNDSAVQRQPKPSSSSAPLFSMNFLGKSGEESEKSLNVKFNNNTNKNSESLQPLSVINCASIRNNNGQIALHIYCDLPQLEPLILLTLIESYPEGLLVEDNNKYLPIHVICDNKAPDYDILLLMIRGDIGRSSLSIGVPGGSNSKGEVNKLLPLHFLVGMTEKINIGICLLVAALHPDAIHSGEARNTVDNTFCWTPYSKARERGAFRLVAQFDKILEDEDFRGGIIKSYLENIVTIVDEIKTKGDSESFNNLSENSFDGGHDRFQVDEMKASSDNISTNGNTNSNNRDDIDANNVSIIQVNSTSNSFKSLQQQKSSKQINTINNNNSIQNKNQGNVQPKVIKSIYAKSAVSKLYASLSDAGKGFQDEDGDESSILYGDNYRSEQTSKIVQSKVYDYKKPITLKSIIKPKRGDSITDDDSPDIVAVTDDDLSLNAEPALPSPSKGGLNPSPLTDPLAVRRFVEGAFDVSIKKKKKIIAKPVEKVSTPPLSPSSGPKISQKDVSATMKRLQEMGLLKDTMAEKANKNKSLIDIHKYLCDFEDTDEYVAPKEKKKKNNPNDFHIDTGINNKLPEVKNFVEGSIQRNNQLRASRLKNLIQTEKYVFTPSTEIKIDS